MGEQQHHPEQQSRENRPEPQGHADDMGNGLQLVLAPVLGPQHHGPLPRAAHQHLEQELDLVAQAHAAHGLLAVAAQHDGVHQVYPKGQQILQSQGQRQGKEGAVKGLLLNHGSSPLDALTPSSIPRRREFGNISFPAQ